MAGEAGWASIGGQPGERQTPLQWALRTWTGRVLGRSDPRVLAGAPGWRKCHHQAQGWTGALSQQDPSPSILRGPGLPPPSRMAPFMSSPIFGPEPLSLDASVSLARVSGKSPGLSLAHPGPSSRARLCPWFHLLWALAPTTVLDLLARDSISRFLSRIREQLCVSQTDPATGMTGPSVGDPRRPSWVRLYVFAGGLDMQTDLFAEEDLGAPFLQGRALEQMAVIYKEIPLREQGGEQDDYRGPDPYPAPFPPQSIPSGDRAQGRPSRSAQPSSRNQLTTYRITGSAGKPRSAR